MLLDSLMVMETSSVSCGPHKIIQGCEHLLTPFAFTMTSSSYVRRIPLKLARPIMGVAMKYTNHEVKLIALHKVPETRCIKGLAKGTSNVIGTTNLFLDNGGNKLINDSQRIFRPAFQVRSSMYI